MISCVISKKTRIKMPLHITKILELHLFRHDSHTESLIGCKKCTKYHLVATVQMRSVVWLVEKAPLQHNQAVLLFYRLFSSHPYLFSLLIRPNKDCKNVIRKAWMAKFIKLLVCTAGHDLAVLVILCQHFDSPTVRKKQC